jgi:Domain of unknown function (DUF4190)
MSEPHDPAYYHPPPPPPPNETQPYPPQYPPPGYPPPAYPAGPYPAPYPPLGYGHPYVQRATNGMAIASMVLGILWLYWIGSILALIFGFVARRQIKQRNESGDGMAIAGIVLGFVGIGTLLIVFIVVAISAGTS